MVIPPRSELVGSVKLVGMVTDSGDLAVQRAGEDLEPGDSRLADGDVLLLQGRGLRSTSNWRTPLRYEWPVLQATWPVIVLPVGAGVGLVGSDTAVTIALVVNAAILFVWGVAVARVHGATPPLMLAVGTLSCGLGVALVVLKLALH